MRKNLLQSDIWNKLDSGSNVVSKYEYNSLVVRCWISCLQSFEMRYIYLTKKQGWILKYDILIGEFHLFQFRISSSKRLVSWMENLAKYQEIESITQSLIRVVSPLMQGHPQVCSSKYLFLWNLLLASKKNEQTDVLFIKFWEFMWNIITFIN